MRIGVIGLGRMGGAIAQRLMRGGHECVVYDHSAEAVAASAKQGGAPAKDLDDFIAQLSPPRVAWVMLPAGAPTEDTLSALAERMQAGDVLIDGGNTFYRDDIRRAAAFRAKGLAYVDVGTSGGVWGLDRGYSLMVGGDKDVVALLDPILKTLAPGLGDIPRTPGATGTAEQGYIHAGPAGAGHFVKMVHNGVEYGLMQAYAEGFDILKNKNGEMLPEGDRFDLNLAEIAEVWRRGSVVSSWLLDLIAQALAKDASLAGFEGAVADSGEARWTIQAALEEAVPADVLAASLFARFRSREEHTFGERLLSAMRFGFGGHVEVKP